MMFRNENANVLRRASSQSEASQSASSSAVTRQPSPDKETVAKQLFFDQFVTSSHLSYLEETSIDELLSTSVLACALAVMATRENDPPGHELAQRYYVEAITATNAALRNTAQVKEDSTLISIYLLSMFEVCRF